MAQIVILANSIRPGGRCIAGLSFKTGNWIRPVPQDGSGAIPNSHTDIASLDMLDIVNVRIVKGAPQPAHRYQKENRIVRNYDWAKEGKLPAENVFQCCEETPTILHSKNDRVDPRVLEKLPPTEWKSLQLIRTQVLFHRDSRKESRWRACFYDRSGNYLSINVTHPPTTQKLNAGEQVGPECLLTVSLASPWTPVDGSQPERCYKVIAGVITIP